MIFLNSLIKIPIYLTEIVVHSRFSKRENGMHGASPSLRKKRKKIKLRFSSSFQSSARRKSATNRKKRKKAREMKNRSSRKLAFVPRPYCTKQISIRGEHLLLLFLLSFLKIDCWIRPKKRTILYRRVGGRPPPPKKKGGRPRDKERGREMHARKQLFFLHPTAE